MCEKIPKLKLVRDRPEIRLGDLSVFSINSVHINIYVYMYRID